MANTPGQPHRIEPIVPSVQPEIEPRRANPEVEPSQPSWREIPDSSPDASPPFEHPADPGSPSPEISPPDAP